MAIQKVKQASDILHALRPPKITRADGPDEEARKRNLAAMQSEAETLISNLSLSPKEVLCVIDDVKSRNEDTHTFGPDDYDNADALLPHFQDLRKQIDCLKSGDELFNQRCELLNFVDKMMLLCNQFSAPVCK